MLDLANVRTEAFSAMCFGFHVLNAVHCEAGEFFNMIGTLFASNYDVSDQITDPNLFINEIQFQKINISLTNRAKIFILRPLIAYVFSKIFNGVQTK